MDEYIISTMRLNLRRWQESDYLPFAAMNSDPVVMAYFPRTLTGEETLQFIERINKGFDQNGFGLYALETKADHQFIGFTGFARPGFDAFFTPCIEIGWRLKKEVWGQGFATEAATACLQYGFDVLRLDNVFSFTAVVNKRSENVMKRIGMHKKAEFNHPKVDAASPLCRHVLYQASRAAVQ